MAKQVLPIAVTGKTDVVRLKRELEELNETMHQAGLRKGGTPVELPKTSKQLDELAKAIGTNLLHEPERKKLLDLIDKIIANAPVVHISFASQPSPTFLAKVTEWFRNEIHPVVLLQVGLQPSIAAGCVVRTPNRQFDLSLREFLKEKQTMLAESVRGSNE